MLYLSSLLLLFASLLAGSASAQSDCGTSRCFNGGTCIESQANGITSYHCDCTSTYASGTAFAGQYCQYQASSFCPTNDGSNVKLFCVNGGTCRADPYKGCICSAQFTGFACEYKAQDVAGGTTAVTNNNNWPNPSDPTGTSGTGTAGASPTQAPFDYVARNNVKYGTSSSTTGTTVYQQPTSQNNTTSSSSTQGKTVYNSLNNGGGTSSSSGNTQQGTTTVSGGKIVYNNQDHLSGNTQNSNNNGGVSTLPPVNDIDICTINGSTLDATPLSFCVNGGSCLRMVIAADGHAGCSCPKSWTGPHCEVSSAASTYSRSSASAVGKSFGVAVIAIATLAIIIVLIFSVVMYCRNKRRTTPKDNRVRWGTGYSDEPSSLNLAPRRSFAESDYPVSTHISSTRDPMAAFHAKPRSTSSMTEGFPLSPQDADPTDSVTQVYLGPPRDEDGHVLHSVEIL